MVKKYFVLKANSQKSQYLFCCFNLEYNDLKTELKDYLKRFADEGTVCQLKSFNYIPVHLNKLYYFLWWEKWLCILNQILESRMQAEVMDIRWWDEGLAPLGVLSTPERSSHAGPEESDCSLGEGHWIIPPSVAWPSSKDLWRRKEKWPGRKKLKPDPFFWILGFVVSG